MQELFEHHHTFTKEQKMGFVLLFIFAVLVVGLGFLQMRNTIYAPFVVKSQKSPNQITIADETVRLQSIDTDFDGLNDYEELYFYQTSPYIPDTDSDGFTDNEEIVAGTNPLCPENKTCIEEEPIDSDTATGAGQQFSIFDTQLQDNPLVNPNVIGSNGTTDLSAPYQAPINFDTLLNDPNEIRKLLLSTGQITEADLNNISDEMLLDLANGAANQSFGSGDSSQTTDVTNP